jgi:hypothetical protein
VGEEAEEGAAGEEGEELLYCSSVFA